jgi:hypothetical protein
MGSPLSRHRPPRSFVIVHDEPDGSLTFLKRYALVLDWTVCESEADALIFSSRERAAQMLHCSGQNRYGWRVLQWT